MKKQQFRKLKRKSKSELHNFLLIESPGSLLHVVAVGISEAAIYRCSAE